MKILRVGDPHAKVSCLDEMRSLVLFIADQAKVHKVDRIEILGDLFHTHNVIRLEVLEFWVWALDLLAAICETVVLVGNHDLSGDYNSTFSALSVFGLMNKPNLKIIESPTVLGVFGYVPYTHDSSSFTGAASVLADKGARVLICHQTIEGSKYDNGMYAPDGIPAGQWSERFVHVISGHIHSEQSFGNILYPGTARWDTISDANRRKGIWLYDHYCGQDGPTDPKTGERSGGTDGQGDLLREVTGNTASDRSAQNGQIRSALFISTEKVCSPIQHFEWREGDPSPTGWPSEARVTVELIGSSTWVAIEKEKLKGKCGIKTKITDKQKGVIRKSGNSFEQFMKEFYTSTFDKDTLMKYAKEIGVV